MRWLTRRLATALVACVLAASCPAWPGRADAGPPRRPLAGPLVTIYTPQRQQFELALDEVELNFPAGQGAGAGAAAAAVEIAGSRLELADGRRAIFALSGVTDLAGLSGPPCRMRRP